MSDISIFNPDCRFTPEQEERLSAPLDANRIKYRPGAGGMQLKYIKGDDVIDKANEIFGFGRWGYKIVGRSHEIVDDRKNGPTDVYTADIELYVVGSAFPFPGDGMGIVGKPYTVEMHEKARKEATTDALKRALRHYGDQFGLSLYNEDDYVNAGSGMLVQVREVKPGRREPSPRRIVDERPSIQLPEQRQPDQKKARLNALFDAGKSKGLYSNVREMALFISDGLQVEITPNGITALDETQLWAVEQAVQNAQGLVVIP